jgi:hypothetical protein
MAQILRNIFSPSSKTHEKRVIFVGTRGSSKTTALGCLALTCDILSSQDKNFRHYIDEKTSGICQVPSDLCQGRFPEATPPGFVYEADLILKWSGNLGEKTVCLPFCETAGEDIENLIGPYQKSVYRKPLNYEEADQLNRFIGDSNGYVLVVPVSRAHIPGIPQMDEEPEALLQDPDVNLSRILKAVYRHKKNARSPPIEGIAVLLTKYDMVDVWLRTRGMGLCNSDGTINEQGAQSFLSTYFRQTMSTLKYYGMDKVRFFPVHVQAEKHRLADGTVVFTKHDDGTYKIAVDQERNLPIYNEMSYRLLIQWIKETFIT